MYYLWNDLRKISASLKWRVFISSVNHEKQKLVTRNYNTSSQPHEVRQPPRKQVQSLFLAQPGTMVSTKQCSPPCDSLTSRLKPDQPSLSPQFEVHRNPPVVLLGYIPAVHRAGSHQNPTSKCLHRALESDVSLLVQHMDKVLNSLSLWSASLRKQER